MAQPSRVDLDHLQGTEERGRALMNKILDIIEDEMAEDVFNACANVILAVGAQAPTQDARNEIAGMMRDIAVMLEQPVEDEDAEEQKGNLQ